MQKVDPFSDLDTMLQDPISDDQNLDGFYDMSKNQIAAGYSRIENENNFDYDNEWKVSRGTFDAIQEMQDELM